MDNDLVFSVSGEMSALHSAEFDDISVNLAEDDSGMTIEGRRFVFINGFSLVLNSFDTSSVTYTVVFRLSVAVQLIAWKDFSRVTCCVSSRNYNHTNLGALSTDRTVFTMVSAKQFCLCYFFK